MIDWAMDCRIIVLPALGGDTMRPRWPLPMGATRSMILGVRSSVLPLPTSSFKRSSANNGVKFSKMILFLAFSGASKLISLTLSSAK